MHSFTGSEGCLVVSGLCEIPRGHVGFFKRAVGLERAASRRVRVWRRYGVNGVVSKARGRGGIHGLDDTEGSLDRISSLLG